MTSFDVLQEQTLAFRRAIVRMLEEQSHRADIKPPTWNNTLHWHAGHLITTPRVLTYGLMGEPLGVPKEYRAWFAKGTSPDGWGDAPIPSYSELVSSIVDLTVPVLDEWRVRGDEPFPEPYPTSVGAVLRTPAQALSFSLAHDGTHMGMIQALIRGLNGMGA
jgi:hypothetical protein